MIYVRFVCTDGVPVANPTDPYTQHAQLRAIVGHRGVGDPEEENRQSGKCGFPLTIILTSRRLVTTTTIMDAVDFPLVDYHPQQRGRPEEILESRRPTAGLRRHVPEDVGRDDR